MLKINCKICSGKLLTKLAITRSKEKKKIYICRNCDFNFFNFNPVKNLEKNKLDAFRLKKAGLHSPKIKENFKNSLIQSRIYIQNFLKEKKKINLLEIGCGHGSFLYLAKKNGHNVYGLELNDVYRKFINTKLNITCYKTISDLEKTNIKFKKIFLFYSFEYFPNIKSDLKRLLNLLINFGQIIIITPNKNDILNTLFKCEGYDNFFYDINSVNYFTKKSLINLLKKMNLKNFKIETKQGYGLANFFNWAINQKPINTGLVGEDRLLLKILNNFVKQKQNRNYKLASNKIKELFLKTDIEYKKILFKAGLGNQIILKIKKSAS